MFKKSLNLVLVFIFIFLNINILEVNAIKIVSKSTYEDNKKEISIWEMFIFFGELYNKKIPETYKYIDLKIEWVEKNTKMYYNLQKLVYVDVLKNNPIKINLNKKINAYAFYRFAEKSYKVSLINDIEINKLKSRKAIFKDFERIENKLKINSNDFEVNQNKNPDSSKIQLKKEIFWDVYKTIVTKHYNRDNINEIDMIDEATKALAKGSWDKYTTYFPPVDNKNFNEGLTWEYEWIGAYVDLTKPGEFIIVSPLSDSPAEKAWLKGWDRVLKVWDKEITKNNGSAEIVSWIKWPSWTPVVLTIKRWNKTLKITVIRAKIIIKEVESKKINSNTLYIEMKFFWPTISREFTDSLEILKTDKSIKKIIFDLRWNWGWYLEEVSDMLWNFVPEWSPTAIVKYYDNKYSYKSIWYSDIDFSKYKMIVLQNWWTASASEIFIWTLKDYYPKTTIIWEQSYWKGSVQTIKDYSDGSSLKYTIAKWYTWKNEIWIDWVGITPDINIKMKKYWVSEKNDLQLQKALRLR